MRVTASSPRSPATGRPTMRTPHVRTSWRRIQTWIFFSTRPTTWPWAVPARCAPPARMPGWSGSAARGSRSCRSKRAGSMARCATSPVSSARWLSTPCMTTSPATSRYMRHSSRTARRALRAGMSARVPRSGEGSRMSDAPGTLLELERLQKVYPGGTAALRGVDLTVRAASVHGLLGANGAGKSTLIRVLSGATRATAGDIVWRGERVSWSRPAQARAAGIATLHQQIPLVGTLSVLENVFLAQRGGWRRGRQLEARLRRLMASIGYERDIQAPVATLPTGERQMVGILQALAAEATLIVMDEPTASLAAAERRIVHRT